MSLNGFYAVFNRLEREHGRCVLRLVVGIGTNPPTSLRQCLISLFGCDTWSYGVYDSAKAAGLVGFSLSRANRGKYGIGRAPRVPALTPAGLAVLEELRKAQLEDLGESLKGEL